MLAAVNALDLSTQRADDALIDAAIDELDRVMNGCEPGDEVPSFTAEAMFKMRAIIRKLLDVGCTRPSAALTLAHPSRA